MTQDKELLIEEIESFTDEQVEVFKLLLEMANNYSNKGDIMKAVDCYKNVDSAIPKAWADKMREHGVNPVWYVWSYQDNHAFGEPVHLLEKLYDKMIKAFKP